MKSIITIILLSLSIGVYSQAMKEYRAKVAEAMDFYKNKEFQSSAEKFKEAFDVLDGKAIPADRYNAACSYALFGEKKTAFYHLFRLANDSKYDNYIHIIEDRDLISLHNDPDWNKLTAIVQQNKELAEANLDKELVAILDTIYREDQKYRININDLINDYGFQSEEVQSQIKKMNVVDSSNLIKIKRILDKYGWLGPDVVGKKGSLTLFIVVQHAGLKIQEEYLPMLREAVKNGNVNKGYLAMLEDRVATGNGRKQIYGTQIGMNPETGKNYILPLEDPENVNELRRQMDLPPMEVYLSSMGMSWSLDEYYTNLPSPEEK